MTYAIADESFPTKSAITERARIALSRTPDGQPTAELDTEFLLALFQNHDEWAQKSAAGVREITTQTTVHGTRCFVLRKHDGTAIDISFPHAIRLIPSLRSADILPQGLRDFRNAARTAISTQIFAFRDNALKQPQQCQVTGEPIIRSNAAVDHVTPHTFDELIFSFCHKHGINPLKVIIGSEGGVVAVFKDEVLLNQWQLFHHEHANLRLISRLGNLKLSKPRVTWSVLWTSEP